MKADKQENDIQKKIASLIAAELGVDEEEVTPSASLRDDLGADSLDETELVMTLEDAFDLEIPDDQIDDLKTVQNVIDFIAKHQK